MDYGVAAASSGGSPSRELEATLLPQQVTDRPPSGRQKALHAAVADALNVARSAHHTGDVEQSRVAHSLDSLLVRFGEGYDPNEDHATPGGPLKDAVHSGLDGMITTCVVLAGGVGLGMAVARAALMATSVLVAEGLALAAGEYLSGRSYHAYVTKEFNRETWEMDVCAPPPPAARPFRTGADGRTARRITPTARSPRWCSSSCSVGWTGTTPTTSSGPWPSTRCERRAHAARRA